MPRWPKAETKQQHNEQHLTPHQVNTENIKVELWVNAWLAYCQRTTVDFTKAKLWADQAVRDFEATFENAPPREWLREWESPPVVASEPAPPLPAPPTAVLQTPRPRPRPTATANAVPTGFPESETVSVKV